MATLVISCYVMYSANVKFMMCLFCGNYVVFTTEMLMPIEIQVAYVICLNHLHLGSQGTMPLFVPQSMTI